MPYETIRTITAQLTEKSDVYLIIAFMTPLCKEIGGKNVSKRAYLKERI